MTDQEKALADIASKLLDRTIGFIPRVDGRAQVLLGLNLGTLLTLALNIPTSKLIAWTTAPAGIAVLMFAISLGHIFRSAFPRLEGGANSLTYFREISKLREVDFIERSMKRDIDAYIRDLLSQVWRNSEIATLKFEALAAAMRWFIYGLPFWLIALVLFVAETNKLALK